MRDVSAYVSIVLFPLTIGLSGTWTSVVNIVDILISIYKSRKDGSSHQYTIYKIYICPTNRYINIRVNLMSKCLLHASIIQGHYVTVPVESHPDPSII